MSHFVSSICLPVFLSFTYFFVLRCILFLTTSLFFFSRRIRNTSCALVTGVQTCALPISDKPIKYILLSHYYAVRVLGASAYDAQEIIASRDTYDLIVERGEQDKASEIGRFPRLFRNVESVPEGLTWPTITFEGEMTVNLGNLEVQILRSEEHTSELQSLMRISYAVFCLKKKQI